MRDDKNLNFIANIPSDQLDPLVQIITQSKDGHWCLDGCGHRWTSLPSHHSCCDSSRPS